MLTENKEFKSRSQWELIWYSFKQHKIANFCLWILGVFLVFIIFAEFLIPNSAFTQYNGKVFTPPRKIRFMDSDGSFSFRPFIYGYDQELNPDTWQREWTEKKDEKYPIYFFVRGFKYKFLGFIPTNLHLFGLEKGAPPLFIFGSDKLGADLFSRTIYATRVSLSIAILGVIISLVLGIVFGGISGFYGGVIDNLIQRISELLLTIPKLPLWLAMAAAIPSNWSVLKIYLSIVIIISLMSWPWLARGIRSKLISMREEDYIFAAKGYGASDSRIIFKYLIPNFMSYIIVSITLAVPGMILMETSLSFLGLGLRSPAVSWGVLLEQAQNFQNVILHPWLLIPGMFVIISILALNFVGDGLRDAADPYERV